VRRALVPIERLAQLYPGDLGWPKMSQPEPVAVALIWWMRGTTLGIGLFCRNLEQYTDDAHNAG
jgi:hypothetical protein